MIGDREGGRDNTKHDHDAEGSVTEKSGGAGEFAIAQRTLKIETARIVQAAPSKTGPSSNGVITAQETTRFTSSSCNLSLVRPASVQQPNDNRRDQKRGDDCNCYPECHWRIERVPKSEKSLACDRIHLSDVVASR